MKCVQGLVVILGLALAAGELSAQGIANANPAVRGSGYPWSSLRAGRSRALSLSSYFGSPYGFGYSSSFGSVTFLQPYRPSTVIIVLPRGDAQSSDRAGDDQPPEGVIRIRPRREREQEREKEAKPPERPAQAPEPIPPPQPKDQPKPPPKEQPKPPPPPPRVDPPKDPLAESARNLAVGKDAFAAGEYGRAFFRFRKAAEGAPDQALPHFLLAQALTALGKYRDAVSAIHVGLALDPTWPATGPRLAALYGPGDDEIALHLQQLDAARAQHPDDAVLLFLQAYILWFDGRKDDARPLFQKAAVLVPDRKDIDRFLQE